MTGRRDEADQVEITEEMISVGADVLWRYPFWELSPGDAKELAAQVLRSALEERLAKTDVVGCAGE